MVCVELEDHYLILGAGADLAQGLDKTRHTLEPLPVAWAVGADVDVEPYLAAMLLGQVEDLLVRRQGADLRRPVKRYGSAIGWL